MKVTAKIRSDRLLKINEAFRAFDDDVRAIAFTSSTTTALAAIHEFQAKYPELDRGRLSLSEFAGRHLVLIHKHGETQWSLDASLITDWINWESPCKRKRSAVDKLVGLLLENQRDDGSGHYNEGIEDSILTVRKWEEERKNA